MIADGPPTWSHNNLMLPVCCIGDAVQEVYRLKGRYYEPGVIDVLYWPRLYKAGDFNGIVQHNSARTLAVFCAGRTG